MSGRHLTRHPWQIGLAILGIALGVAVALSVDLATQSARRAFALAAEAITGRATHQVVGGPSGVPSSVYRALKLELSVPMAAPVIALDAAAIDHPGRVFQILGVDPFAEAPFRPYLAARGRDLAALADLVARPGAALVARSTAAELGIARGGRLDLRIAGVRRTVTVIGWLEPRDALSARALASLIVTDLATAQELAGTPGALSRIDVIVRDGSAGRALLERIRVGLPAGVEIVPAGSQAAALASMTAAFTLNLTALSLLALVVGMFLIYNTMTFSVVQRRPVVGLLRVLGVTPGEIFTLVLGEALVVGVLGTAAGILLGLGLAHGLLSLVTRTINDLYFVLSVREVTITPSALVQSVALGTGATLAAALVPAIEATRARPRETLNRSRIESHARRVTRWSAWSGAGLLLAGATLLGVPRTGVGWGFGSLFLLLMGAALATPAAGVTLLRLVEAPVRLCFGLVGQLAARAIVASLSRTAVAIAALMVSIAATIGVGIMIASFREAVAQWLAGTLRADIYVSPPSLLGNRPDGTLDAALVHRLGRTPGVAATGTSRGVVVPSPTGPVHVVALGLPPGRPPGFTFASGNAARAWAAAERGAVVVSEPFAYRHGVGAGGVVRLRTDRGEHAFPIADVYADYGSSAGVVLMSRGTYERFWDDRGISALALYAAPGTDTAVLLGALREQAAGLQEVVIRSNRALRDASLAIFDRTFRITEVLRLLIVSVAFVGVLSALMALQLERGREMGVLRALGVTPRQIWGMVSVQTGLMGALAGALAVPVGIMLAAVLVLVINRRSFGWTMPIDVSPTILVHGVLLAFAAAVLAGLYPAWKMGAASAAEALRDE